MKLISNIFSLKIFFPSKLNMPLKYWRFVKLNKEHKDKKPKDKFKELGFKT